jgi:phosphoribosylformylglycinamidine synthase
MLLVVKAGREAEVERVFEKWDLHAVRIGHVTDDGLMRVKEAGTVVAELPNKALADEAPLYDRPRREPAWLAGVRALDLASLPAGPAAGPALLALLATPEIASKRWVYRQYDHMVRTNTIVLPGMGAGVVRVKGTDRALAMSVDGNGRFCYLDPFLGAQLCVAEAARNVACAGGLPIGATNNLNFGNPEKPEIMWQLAEAVRGIGVACRALGIPITGGNVSLYNETDGTAILPTPVLGVVGLVEHADRARGRAFPSDGAAIVVLGENRGELGGSAWLKAMHGLVRGAAPVLDLDAEKRLQALLVDETSSGAILSAHDCSEGGFAVTLAECCFDTGGRGAEVDVPRAATDHLGEHQRDAGTLFGESASRVIVSVAPDQLDAFLARAAAAGVPSRVAGRTGGSRLVVRLDGGVVIDVAVDEAEAAWNSALERYFAKQVA